jgi:hypothetical protein
MQSKTPPNFNHLQTDKESGLSYDSHKKLQDMNARFQKEDKRLHRFAVVTGIFLSIGCVGIFAILVDVIPLQGNVEMAGIGLCCFSMLIGLAIFSYIEPKEEALKKSIITEFSVLFPENSKERESVIHILEDDPKNEYTDLGKLVKKSFSDKRKKVQEPSEEITKAGHDYTEAPKKGQINTITGSWVSTAMQTPVSRESNEKAPSKEKTNDAEQEFKRLISNQLNNGYEVAFQSKKQTILINRSKDIISYRRIRSFGKVQHESEEIAYKNLKKISVYVIPNNFAIAYHNKYTIGGALVGGIGGLVVGSVIDGIRGPKKDNVSVTFTFHYNGGSWGGKSLCFDAYKKHRVPMTDESLRPVLNEVNTLIRKIKRLYADKVKVSGMPNN